VAAGFANDELFEFVELYNAGDGSLDLRGVRFVDGVEFDFSASEVERLGPGEYLLLVADRAAFEFRYGLGLPVAGEYSGRFSNGGERVEVVDGEGRSLIRFTFGTTTPWPGSPDGDGESLTLTDVDADPDLGGNWRASVHWGGTPGRGELDGLRIEYVRREGAGLTLGFNARSGKGYALQTRRDWTEAWTTLTTVPAGEGAGLREVGVAWESSERSTFFQLMEVP
jgi:hypothetical protein